MNERIEELAERATIISPGHGAFGEPEIREHLDIEKFAELLVQECATYLNVAVEVHNQNEQDVCDRAARDIKRYFGVK